MTATTHSHFSPPQFLTRIRARAERAFLYIGNITDLAGQTIEQMRRGPVERPLLIAQLEQIGVRSLGIV
ncbi:MAG TPA: hypothetical protein VHL59_18735, partial [Thermoanaerobaculia bacterium]|nr:hypothetical protein [Thermoanaerobaculia bacterium]